MNHFKREKRFLQRKGSARRLLSFMLAMVMVLSLVSGNGLALAAYAQEAEPAKISGSEEESLKSDFAAEAVPEETEPDSVETPAQEAPAQDAEGDIMQELIDALPETEDVLEENTETVDEQLDAMEDAGLEALAEQVADGEPEPLTEESRVTSEVISSSYSVTYYIYANGTPLILKEGTGGTKYTVIYEDLDGDGQVTDRDRIYAPAGLNSTEKGNIYDTCYILGGSDQDTISGNTSVTMEGGKVTAIYGGCWSGTVTGNTNVTVSGGTVSSVYGAGKKEASCVTGNTMVSITGGSVGNGVYGGGYDGTVGGSTEVSVTGGTVDGYVCGGSSGTDGGATGDIAGSTCVVIDGSASVAAVTGGSYYSGTVGQDTEVRISGGTITGSSNHAVYGSGYEGKVTGNVNIIMDGGTVNGRMYGTSYRSNAAAGKDVSISITGGSVTGYVLAKGAADVGGNVSLTVGGSAQVGSDGVTIYNGIILNCNNPDYRWGEKKGIDHFAIAPDLAGDAKIFVYLPEKYVCTGDPVVAEDGAESDISFMELKGSQKIWKESTDQRIPSRFFYI